MLDHDSEVIPNVSTEELHDKSKAGGLAKALLVWQVLWFCISSVERLVQHLPLSLFEVMTFAHGICTLMACVLWWHKPKDVNEPIMIPGEQSSVRRVANAEANANTEWPLPSKSYIFIPVTNCKPSGQ